MSNTLSVHCPYCDHLMNIDISSEEWKNSIHETLVTPLVTRLGQYHDKDIGKWVEVASFRKGYKNLLLGIWNRSIGILRYPGHNRKILTREVICPVEQCLCHYEIFLNLSSDLAFSDLWPHLTGNLDSSNTFTPWPVKRRFEKFMDRLNFSNLGDGIFILVLAAVISVITLLPTILVDTLTRAELVHDLILRVLSAILVGFMLISLRGIGMNLRKGKDVLRELIRVKENNSFLFWYNYTLARFAGVDLSADQKKLRKSTLKRRTLYITQSDALGGIPSLILFVVIWIVVYSPYRTDSTWALMSSFIFWGLIAYIVGMIGQVAINFSVSITENIAMLPMKLTPLNNYVNLWPIKNIIKSATGAYLSLSLIPILFFAVRYILPSQANLINYLLIPWFFTSFSLALLVLTNISTTYIKFLIFLSAIFAAYLFLPDIFDAQLSSKIFMLVLGLYWTAFLVYLLRSAFSPVQGVLEKNKQLFLQSLDRRLRDLTDAVNNPARFENPENNEVISEIDRIIKIREIAQKSRTSIINYRTGLQIVSPVLSSLFAPMVIEFISNYIYSKLIG